jgi:hypothetical protein
MVCPVHAYFLYLFMRVIHSHSRDLVREALSVFKKESLLAIADLFFLKFLFLCIQVLHGPC